MNTFYKGIKDKGSLIAVPSSALEAMNLSVMDFASMKARRANRAANACANAPAPALSLTPPSLSADNSIPEPPFPGPDL
jgi:hypothetical protein